MLSFKSNDNWLKIDNFGESNIDLSYASTCNNLFIYLLLKNTIIKYDIFNFSLEHCLDTFFKSCVWNQDLVVLEFLMVNIFFYIIKNNQFADINYNISLLV